MLMTNLEWLSKMSIDEKIKYIAGLFENWDSPPWVSEFDERKCRNCETIDGMSACELYDGECPVLGINCIYDDEKIIRWWLNQEHKGD